MEFVDMTADHGVAVVTLNRPPVNALSHDVAEELLRAFRECEDPEIRSVVVTGRPHFAAGADIKGFKETFDSGGEERSASALLEAVGVLDSLPKPTMAAVHGYALGGGCELALGCDFRYLAEDARIGQPEILLGIIPGAGGTQRLQRVVGFQAAKEMIFTGRQVEASEALELGLADKVAPADELDDLALADARKWATGPTVALGAAKRALAEGRGMPLEDGLRLEQDQFGESFATDDAREGVSAFVEKREAEFKGR